MIDDSLILFYSWSGNTRRVAHILAEHTGADLYALRPETPYPSDYQQTLARVRREMQEKARPALCPLPLDWDRYETVFLGTPNWCGTMAPPLASFLYQTMPTERCIVPFCTHGGGGAGRIAQDIAYYCIGCDLLPLLALRDDGGAGAVQAVERWLDRVEKRLALLRCQRQEADAERGEACP